MLEIRLVAAFVARAVRLTEKWTLGHVKTLWGDGNLLYFDLNMSLYVNDSIEYIFCSSKDTVKKGNEHAHQERNYFH